MRFFISVFLVLSSMALAAQSGELRILITDQEGNPVDAAVLAESNGLFQVISNNEGIAEIRTAQGHYILLIRSIGYQDTAIRVSVPGDVTLALRKHSYDIPVVYVYGHMADVHHPVTYTNVDGKELNRNNYGQDMPLLLQQTPSAVATSDAGNGVGYTGIRIRGLDPTRVNISLNGIPFNDAESQQAYWVDMPDIAASTDKVQIQRGIGTSVNGVSAMGASINLVTNQLSDQPAGAVSYQTGSYGLQRLSATMQTGWLRDHWQLEARMSGVRSDGYVDRASADLRSYFLTGAWKGDRYRSVLNVFSGKERTYQAWAGIPADSLVTNRTYNPYTYSDQVDDYRQTHAQWHQYWTPDEERTLTISGNLTSGAGYYEQLEYDQALEDYGIEPVNIGDTLISISNLVTRKWLDNLMYGGLVRYDQRFTNSEFTTGAACFLYDGAHFGEVIRGDRLPVIDPPLRYYDDQANKTDANIYAQWLYRMTSRVYLWADLQFRYVGYQFTGIDSSGLELPASVSLPFLNPKAGVRWQWTPNVTSYISLAMAGREPNRDDYISAIPGAEPAPEFLYDAELGTQYARDRIRLSANLYYMYFHDQLVLTGQLNEVGAYIRQNIPRSFRAGLELVWTADLGSGFEWQASMTRSMNRIMSYTQYLDNWDEGGQESRVINSTTIAFSPEWIINSSLFWNSSAPVFLGAWLTGQWDSRFVSRQYLDNTEDQAASLDPYAVQDLVVSLSWKKDGTELIIWNLRANNLLNELYESNGWSYRYFYAGEEQVLTGYYPQAERHFVTGIIIRF